VRIVHLTEYRKRIVMLFWRHGFRQHCDDSVSVQVEVRWQPQGHAGKRAEPPHGLLRERIAAERRWECREMRQILLRLRIQSALDWVGCERLRRACPKPVPVAVAFGAISGASICAPSSKATTDFAGQL
jgi:hypothetical protein